MSLSIIMYICIYVVVLCFCKVSKLSSSLSVYVEAETYRIGVSATHLCPNPEDQCLDGQTCCQISETDYGCCPFAQAVCCKDMAHCCPHNTLCDLKLDTCRPKITNVTQPETDLFYKLSTINYKYFIAEHRVEGKGREFLLK